MSSLSGPEKIQNPVSNQVLGDHSKALINISREQFGQFQQENRKNLSAMGNRTKELQAKAGARVMQNAGAATERYGPGMPRGSNAGAGIAQGLNNIAGDQRARKIAGQQGLIRDAMGRTTSSMAGLGSLAQTELNRDANNTARQAQTTSDIAGLAGTGLGLYAMRNR